MPKDASQLSDGQTLEADVCIAGAGAAGMTIAKELVGSGISVLLLEGGGEEPSQESQKLYGGETTGVANLSLKGCRIRAFGGSTNCWNGWCRPLLPEVFESRDWIPRSGWPISLDDLLPYYHRAVETVDIGAYQWDAATINEQRDKPLLEFGERAKTVPYQYSKPIRFADEYGDELENADNVEVYLHASVVNIGLNANGDAVDHLACRTLDGKTFTAEADDYVLAMGGLENPRMMLASNDVKPEGVGNDHDHLGRYFMEHPHFYGGAVLATPPGVNLEAYLGLERVTLRDMEHPDGRENTIRMALSLSESERRDKELLPLAATLKSLDVDKEDERTGKIPASATAEALFDGVGGADIAKTAPEHHRLYRLTLRTEQLPLRESRVTLTDETDALGVPRMKLTWRVSDLLSKSVVETMRTLSAEFGRLGAGRIWIPTDNDGHYRLGEIRGGCHHMGTTRMSERADQGVVDANCRVHGVDNLYVGGSSVFPTGGYANPTYTIVALAHRLADRLKSIR